MTLIRLGFGSRVGQVIDMTPHEARAMLADGRATIAHADPVVDSRDPWVMTGPVPDPPPTPQEPGPGGPPPVPTVVRKGRR